MRSIELGDWVSGLVTCEERGCLMPAEFVKRWTQRYPDTKTGYVRTAHMSRRVCEVHARGFAKSHGVDMPGVSA